jgi:hypothetical protein
LLSYERIGITDNFFEIGGNSLSVVKVVGLMIKEGLDITVHDFYKYQTARNISDKLSNNLTENSDKNMITFDNDLLDFAKNINIKDFIDKNSTDGIMETPEKGLCDDSSK